jgi:deazaflavin-dependent oxidoreductase (nitroreductase family)
MSNRRTRWPWPARLFFAAHTALYGLSGGRLGGKFNGPILLLTTTGRKSGQRRTRPLTYFPDGDRFVLVGSNGGRDNDPAWVWNLRHAPDAEVQVGARRLRVRAREVGPAERQRLWPLLLAQTPIWDTYRTKTRRELPMVILELQPAD